MLCFCPHVINRQRRKQQLLKRVLEREMYRWEFLKLDILIRFQPGFKACSEKWPTLPVFLWNPNLLLKQSKPNSLLQTWVNTFFITIKDCGKKKEGPAFAFQESSLTILCIFVGTVIPFKVQPKPNTSCNLQAFNMWRSRVMASGVFFGSFLWVEYRNNSDTCSSGAPVYGRSSEYWRNKHYTNRWGN